MDKTKTKKLSLVGLITLYLACSSAYIGNLIAPVTSAMLGEFAGASTFWKNYLISGAAIIAMIFNALTGVAAQFISKKKLQVIGTLCFCVGGLGLIWAKSLPLFAVLRSLVGVSSGIVLVVTPAIICEMYVDVRERSRFLGYLHVCTTGFGVLFSFFGGLIASRTSSWRNVFFMNLVAVVAFAGAFFLIPDTGAEGKKKNQEKKQKEMSAGGKEEKFNLSLTVFILAGQFLMSMLFYVLVYLIDLYVVENKVGDSMVTGTFSAIGMAAAAVVSVFFSKIYMKTGRWTSPLTWIPTGLCFALLATRPNRVLFLALAAVAFSSWSLNYLYYLQKLSELAPSSKTTMMMSLNSVAASGGGYLSPFIPTALKAVFGVDTMRESYLYIGIIMLIIAATAIVLIYVMKDIHDRPEEKAAAKQASA